MAPAGGLWGGGGRGRQRGERRWGKEASPSVWGCAGWRLQAPQLAVALDDTLAGQRDAALLCEACRAELLAGHRRWLPAFEAHATADWRAAGLTRRERLLELGAPYTPKR